MSSPEPDEPPESVRVVLGHDADGDPIIGYVAPDHAELWDDRRWRPQP